MIERVMLKRFGLPMFIKLIWLAMAVFLILIAGSFTALAPQFVARLIPIPALFLLVILAILSKKDTALNPKTLNTWLVLLLVTMALWPTYFLIKIGGLPSLDARKLLAGISLAAMVFLTISRKPVRLQFLQLFKGPLGVGTTLILSYTLWRLGSCLVSVSPVYSMIQVVWEILYYYSMFFLGALFFNQEQHQHKAIKIMMWLAIGIALLTILEWSLKKNLLAQYAHLGDEFASLQRALASSRMRDTFFRAQGTFEHPLLLAEFAAITFCFGLSALLWQYQQSAIRKLAFATVLLSGVAAFMTGSRSAYVSLTLAGSFIVLLWLFSNERARQTTSSAYRKLVFVVCLVIGLILTIPAIQWFSERGSQVETASTAGRVYMLELGIPSIKSHFLLGTGPGTSGAVAGIRTGAGVSTLDNYFLAITIESGLPALLLLLLIFIYPVWIVANRLMEQVVPTNTFYLGVSGAMVVALITHAVLWMPYNLFFVFLFSGMLLSYEKNQHTSF